MDSCFFEKEESRRGAMRPHTNNFLPHYCRGETDCANINNTGAEPAPAFTELELALRQVYTATDSLSGVDRRRIGNPVSYKQLRHKGSEGDLEEH